VDRQVSFFRRWLKPETSARIGLRPHRVVDLSCPFDDAYSRVLEAIVVTLGANVYLDDRRGRLIEAGFGLVNNERVRVTFEDAAEGTKVRIEAFFPAGASVPEKSAAVDALYDAVIRSNPV
jgi:hypothetical protein